MNLRWANYVAWMKNYCTLRNLQLDASTWMSIYVAVDPDNTYIIEATLNRHHPGISTIKLN